MKNILLTSALVVCMSGFAVDENKPVVLKKSSQVQVAPRTAADVKKRYAQAKEDREKALKIIQEKLGGLVTMPNKEPGILFLNCQTRLPLSTLDECVNNVKREFMVSCYARQGKFTDIPSFVAQAKDRTKNACTIAVIEDPVLPQMIAMPDNGCAIVNITPLLVGKPDADKLKDRVWRMAYRAFGVAMGAAFSQNGVGILKSAETLEELDANKSRATAPDCHFPIRMMMNKHKVAVGGYATYQDACAAGWAPAPTNDVQKAIYEAAKAAAKKSK